jgi:hypothetical protein
LRKLIDSSKVETGSWELEARSNWKLETGNLELEAEQLETGRLATGN